jgi:hypothetical protein
MLPSSIGIDKMAPLSFSLGPSLGRESFEAYKPIYGGSYLSKETFSQRPMAAQPSKVSTRHNTSSSKPYFPPPNTTSAKPAIEPLAGTKKKKLSDLKQEMQQKEKKHFHVLQRAKNGGKTADGDEDAFRKYWGGEEENRKKWFAEKGIDGDNPNATGYRDTWHEYYDLWKQRWTKRMTEYRERSQSRCKKGNGNGESGGEAG